MQITDAIRFINDELVFRPGWRFTAWNSWEPGIVYVDVRVQTQDTNYPPDYRVPIVAGGPPVELDVSKMSDEDDLLYAIKTRVIEPINDHEDREFLRRRDQGMAAPFHPHHSDGQLRWSIHQARDRRVPA